MPFSRYSKPFYFIRHGQTDANKNKLWCGGDWDIELNENGVNQAMQIAEDIHKLSSEIDLIFSSPMKRALQTTNLFNSKAQKPVSVLEDLREWKVGELEKSPWTYSLLGMPISEWQNPPGGETVSQFKDRVQSAILSCLQGPGCPLISSHGAVGIVLFHLINIPERHISNCQIHKFYPVQHFHGTSWRID